MKLEDNHNINDILEEMCRERFEKFSLIFNKVKEYEQSHNINVNLNTFESIYFHNKSVIEPYKSLERNQAECLYIVYNWYKYRVIYNVVTSDLSIKRYSDYVSTELEEERFFPCYFILYDFKNAPYVGSFVLIEDTKILFALLSPLPKYNLDSVILNLQNSSQTVEQAYNEYYSRLGIDYFEFDEIISLQAVLKMFPYIKNTIQIIRAINQGYNNLFNSVDVPPYNEILPIRTYNNKIVKANVSITRKQIIKVENNQFEFKKKRRFKAFYPKGTLKSPHVRREHWRHVKDKRSQTGCRLARVRSTIVNKDKYEGITEKTVK